MGIAIQLFTARGAEEAFALNKIEKHQAVEHDRGVPLAISFAGNAVNGRAEAVMLDLEALKETLHDLLGVSGNRDRHGYPSSRKFSVILKVRRLFVKPPICKFVPLSQQVDTSPVIVYALCEEVL